MAEWLNNYIYIKRYWVPAYRPLNFAADGGIYVNIAWDIGYERTSWMMGMVGEDMEFVGVHIRPAVEGIAIKEVQTNTQVNLYYTTYESDTGGYLLHREADVYLGFETNQIKKQSVGLNCGSKIVVYDKFLILGCRKQGAKDGLISIYNEQTLVHIYTQTHTSDSYFIGSEIHVISSPFIVSTYYWFSLFFPSIRIIYVLYNNSQMMFYNFEKNGHL